MRPNVTMFEIGSGLLWPMSTRNGFIPPECLFVEALLHVTTSQIFFCILDNNKQALTVFEILAL